MNVYNPDNWVLIKICAEGEEPLYKVLGGWSGGYFHGDSWRLNSGISKITHDTDLGLYHIYGSSGSCYIVSDSTERISGATRSILSRLLGIINVEQVDMKDVFPVFN